MLKSPQFVDTLKMLDLVFFQARHILPPFSIFIVIPGELFLKGKDRDFSSLLLSNVPEGEWRWACRSYVVPGTGALEVGGEPGGCQNVIERDLTVETGTLWQLLGSLLYSSMLVIKPKTKDS